MLQLIVLLHFLCSQPFPLWVQCPEEENMPGNLGGLIQSGENKPVAQCYTGSNMTYLQSE